MLVIYSLRSDSSTANLLESMVRFQESGFIEVDKILLLTLSSCIFETALTDYDRNFGSMTGSGWRSHKAH